MCIKAFVIGGMYCATLWAQTSPVSKVASRVQERVGNFQGKVSLYAKNLDSGASYGLSAEQPTRTASTIKLAIMVECFAEAAEGKLKWTEPLTITKEEKVSGSGIAQDLSDGGQLPLRDMVTLMIVLSDNTATNLLLNRIGGNAVNARMAQLGYEQIRVMQEGSKPENKKWGLGRSSPREMVSLLEKIHRRELISRGASDEMFEILKKQRDHNGIGRDMKNVTIASKSGALDALRSDVGIVYSKHGPIAMAITVDGMPEPNWSPDNPGELLISSLSEILVEELGSRP
jgi:beta-lactamase class A